jgi:transposase
MDLSSTYRAIVRKHFPNAQIVADRFHVIITSWRFGGSWIQWPAKTTVWSL